MPTSTIDIPADPTDLIGIPKAVLKKLNEATALQETMRAKSEAIAGAKAAVALADERDKEQETAALRAGKQITPGRHTEAAASDVRRAEREYEICQRAHAEVSTEARAVVDDAAPQWLEGLAELENGARLEAESAIRAAEAAVHRYSQVLATRAWVNRPQAGLRSGAFVPPARKMKLPNGSYMRVDTMLSICADEFAAQRPGLKAVA